MEGIPETLDDLRICDRCRAAHIINKKYSKKECHAKGNWVPCNNTNNKKLRVLRMKHYSCCVALGLPIGCSVCAAHFEMIKSMMMKDHCNTNPPTSHVVQQEEASEVMSDDDLKREFESLSKKYEVLKMDALSLQNTMTIRLIRLFSALEKTTSELENMTSLRDDLQSKVEAYESMNDKHMSDIEALQNSCKEKTRMITSLQMEKRRMTSQMYNLILKTNLLSKQINDARCILFQSFVLS